MLRHNLPARTAHTARAADPGPPDAYDHRVGARVMTCDGHLGTVEAINDGPYSGTEAYRVTLDAGMGGGDYTGGQLQAAPAHTAGTAAADYPELATTLLQHPDPGRRTAALTTASASGLDPDDEAQLVRSWTAHNRAIGDVNRNGHGMRWMGTYDDLGRHTDDYTHFGYWRAHCPNCGMAMQTDRHGESRAEPDPRHSYGLDSGCGNARTLTMPPETTVGEHGYAPDDRPIERSIGAPCPGCNTPVSADQRDHGCTLCGDPRHHGYCCPSLDGVTARRTASADWPTPDSPCGICWGAHPHQDCPRHATWNASRQQFHDHMRGLGHDFVIGGSYADPDQMTLWDPARYPHGHDHYQCLRCGANAGVRHDGWDTMNSHGGPGGEAQPCVGGSVIRAPRQTVGETGYAPDDEPIEKSIGRPCADCGSPMSTEDTMHGCVFCGDKDHHSYCCPSPDGDA